MNSLPSERIAVVGSVDPDAYTAASPNSSYSTGWVDASKWHSFLAIIQAGDLGSGAELDAKLEQATTSGGGGAKDVTGKAMTQISQADSPNPSNSQILLNCRTEELDVEGGFDYVRLTLTVGDATSDLSGILLGVDPRFGPASDHDLASVVEIVS